MSLVPLPDGTMVVYHWDCAPEAHIWENFDPAPLLEEAKKKEQKEQKKQKESTNVAPSSSSSVAPSPAVVHVSVDTTSQETDRIWLERFERVERLFRIGQARIAAFTPPPSPPPPAPDAPSAQ